MAKRIYWESVKKWGAGGISVGTLVGLIFLYLSITGAITITGYSGDSICDGTIEDPCYAIINFTANEDIFIYPTDYDPWGRNTIFEFAPGVKSWKLERSWGSGWREINLNKSCTGTWCGAPDNTGSQTYAIAFRKGKNYTIRITAYKNSPYDEIKWSVDYNNKEYLDPAWKSSYENTYTETSENHCKDGKCNLLTYASQRFIYEDERWKKIEEARSLKGSSIKCNVISDGENFAECVDWNMTSVTLNLERKESGESPIRIIRWNESASNYEEISRQNYEFNNIILRDKKQINIPKKENDIIHFGENSTEIIINSTTTLNGAIWLYGYTFPPSLTGKQLNMDIRTGRSFTPISVLSGFPTGDGSDLDWNQYPLSGNNWEKVSDSDDATYIYSQTNGLNQSFTQSGISSTTCDSGIISLVRIYARRTDQGNDATMSGYIVIDGVKYSGSPASVPDILGYGEVVGFENNPATSDHWNESSIQSIQEFGITSDTVTNYLNVTDLHFDIYCERYFAHYGVLSFDTSALNASDQIINSTLNVWINSDLSTEDYNITFYSGWDNYTGTSDLEITDMPNYEGIFVGTPEIITGQYFEREFSNLSVNKDGTTQFKFNASNSDQPGDYWVDDNERVYFEGQADGKIPFLNISYETIAGNVSIDYSVALPNGVLRFLNCSPDFENANSQPDGQTSVIAAINATNNGTGVGNFTINLTGALNSGWTIWASNDSLVNNITLSTTAQTIWSNVEVDETKKIWLAGNCSYVSANPGQSISMWVA